MRKIVLRADRKHSALEDAAIILDQGKQQTSFILLLSVLYLFRDLGGVNIPDIVFSGLCAVAFILMDMGTCLGVYMFTTALTVPHNEITIVYLGILLGKILVSGKMQINGRMLLMNLGLMLLQLLDTTIFSTSAFVNVIYDYVTRMLIIIVPIFWFNDEYTAEDFRGALMCYVAGVVLGGTVTLILTAELITWEALLKGTEGLRLGKTYNTDEGMQTNYNANQLSIMCAVSASIILQAMDKKKMSKIWGILLLGYLLFLVVLTRSRTGILMMAMIIVIYYFILVVRRKKLFTGILLLSVIGTIVFAIITFFPDVVQGVVDRFMGQEDITNGRTDLFKIYLAEWSKEPWGIFFGYGSGTFANVIEDAWNYPHNALTDILICGGITGLILISGILSACYCKGTKEIKRKEQVFTLLPAIVAIVASMASQYLSMGYPHVRLCFLLLAAKAWENSDTKQKALGEENEK